MVNNSTRPEIIYNKWSIGIIEMSYNEVFLIVAMDMEIYKTGETMVDASEEGAK